MDDKLVEMIYQYAPLNVKDVVKYLRGAIRKHGDIPVASHGGEGIHICVRQTDKPLSDLGTAFTFSGSRKLRPGVRRLIRKKNPSTKYIYIW